MLVVNAGSASVKLRVVEDGSTSGLASAGWPAAGLAEDLGRPDEGTAGALADFLGRAGRVDCIGHRIVHGGAEFTGPVVVDDGVRARLERLGDLAPLHNPPALAALDAGRAAAPDVPTVATFDTAFHAGLPAAARRYAVPAEWEARFGLRRYGFHGLSCQWALTRAGALLGAEPATLRLVVCHLGGGASATAIVGGRSVDTTMGFTPTEGLVMGTRPGDLDPAAVAWLVLHGGLGIAEVAEALERRSGLAGLTAGTGPAGSTSDMRELLGRRDGGDQVAEEAVAVYVHRLRAKIAAMAAAAGGPDALVFTGGIGEHAPAIRAEACAGLDWMGVTVDADGNATTTGDGEVTGAGGRVRVLVVTAREDAVVAAECRRVLGR